MGLRERLKCRWCTCSQVYTWREDFRNRFAWTSVVAFTLGIVVSLGSLLQVRTATASNNDSW